MTLSALIRKSATVKVATAIPAISATQPGEVSETVARIATVAVANPTERKTANDAANPNALAAEPFDPEAWEERAAIAEFDGGMTRQDAERLAWDEDDRRRCAQCANLTAGGLCLAARRGEITASRNYEPSRTLPRRCEGYAPGADDPDRRPGGERWQGLRGKIGA
jgi:hypothetical protein